MEPHAALSLGSTDEFDPKMGFKDIWPFQNSNQDTVLEFLGAELACPTIDALYPHLHWVARRSGLHIDALHANIVKGRELVVTEDPELHLVWQRKCIWIKPLPIWLLDAEFWSEYLPVSTAADHGDPKERVRLHATGFVRSYTRLIRHESDFLLAQEKNLVHKRLSFADFQRFTNPFRDTDDEAVAPRYQYGQMRLSRLNWAVRSFQPSVRRGRGILGRLYYHQLYWETSDFIQASIAPFVFIFGTLSVVLSSMQVALAVEANAREQWNWFSWTSWLFSISVLAFLAICAAILVLIVVIVLAAQVFWARRHSRPTIPNLTS